MKRTHLSKLKRNVLANYQPSSDMKEISDMPQKVEESERTKDM
jgi:hypothetical protein